MTISNLIERLESMKKIAGYDCDVVFFANGYKTPNVDINAIVKPHRYTDYVVIFGEGPNYPSAEDCIDR